MMTLRDRERAPEHPPIDLSHSADATADQERREIGQSLLAAADRAIERALSEDSARFLAQNRQMGGQ